MLGRLYWWYQWLNQEDPADQRDQQDQILLSGLRYQVYPKLQAIKLAVITFDPASQAFACFGFIGK